ncbi:hypothetical protein CTEN210_18203 [Chaetoceros tenuissimus]|uniref:Hexosyltransferase n=1 Tax=Chaetoceros tenuissimus TaxID=426638 RepID=A0AAD3HF85_9STRA|nr:hypothetical protein CTEN210_18203 [Chaetoceros tenuissimus]
MLSSIQPKLCLGFLFIASPLFSFIIHQTFIEESLLLFHKSDYTLTIESQSRIEETQTLKGIRVKQNAFIPKAENKEPKFAYVFLLAGVYPETLFTNGGFYGILAANEFFKQVVNSTADVVAMIRIHKDSQATSFAPEQEDIFKRVGIKLEYIPKPAVDNFFTAMFDKFRMLSLTEYDRVMFLDSDIQPLCNLDYIFAESMGENATLEPNVIRAGKIEAVNGGLFMLEPNKDDADRAFKYINERYKYGLNWNTTIGWQEIQAPDHWEALKLKNVMNWGFNGGDADQGFLFYWTKYIKRSVSILFPNKIEHWRCAEEVKQGTPLDWNSKCHFEEGKERLYGNDPWIDKQFIHYVSDMKPWFMSSTEYIQEVPTDSNVYGEDAKVFDYRKSCKKKMIGIQESRQLWFQLLSMASRRAQMNINFTSIFPLKYQELGRWATKKKKSESEAHYHEGWVRFNIDKPNRL